MVDPQPPQDPAEQKRKDALRKFHEDNLKSVELQEEKEKRSRSARRADQTGFEERGQQAVLEDDQGEAAKKERTKEWRAADKLQQEEIAKDKARRAEEARVLKERRDKDKAYAEKQHAFFESFREHASKKAREERESYEKDMELKHELLLLDKSVFEAKQKVDSEELRAKNDIDREGLRKRDIIIREYADLERKLFAEEARKKAQYAAMGPQGKALLDQLAKEMAKKRAEIHNEAGLAQRRREQEVVKKKTDVETKSRRRKAELDAEKWKRKAELEKKRKDPEPPKTRR